MKVESKHTDHIGIINMILREQDITQAQMARDCGVNINTISRWVLNDTVPKIDLFEKVLNWYGYQIVIRKEEHTEREIRKEMSKEAKSLEEKVKIARQLGITYGELDARLRGK